MAHTRNGVMSEAKQVKRKARGSARRLKQAVDREAAGMWKEVRNAGSHTAEAIGDGIEQVRDTAEHFLEAGRDRLVGVERSMEEHIRTRPLRSMLIAAGIGLFCGMFFCRRD